MTEEDRNMKKTYSHFEICVITYDVEDVLTANEILSTSAESTTQFNDNMKDDIFV